MPELPEVETVRAGLEKYVLNKRISSAHSYHLRAIKPSSISPLKALVGAKIKAVKRRGKFLWFELDRDFVLVAHLGMSGQLIISSNQSADQSHLRARIELQKIGGFTGKKGTGDEIRFIDQRTFGWLSIEEMQDEIPTSVAHIARSLSVYGRAGQPCSRCATLIRRIAFANRSSHFCPRCQR